MVDHKKAIEKITQILLSYIKDFAIKDYSESIEVRLNGMVPFYYEISKITNNKRDYKPRGVKTLELAKELGNSTDEFGSFGVRLTYDKEEGNMGDSNDKPTPIVIISMPKIRPSGVPQITMEPVIVYTGQAYEKLTGHKVGEDWL